MSRLPSVQNPLNPTASTVALPLHVPAVFSRLVVAIPDEPIEETQLAKEIWALTSANHADVLLLTLLEDWSRESHIRLQHTLVMQMLATTGVRVTSAIVADVDWLAALSRTQQPNDVLLCFAEHLIVPHHSHHSHHANHPQSASAPPRSLARIVPMSVLIVQQLGRPVHIVTGLVQPSKRRRNFLLNLLSWLGFVAVIVGSFWMQIRLDQMMHGVNSALRSVVLSGSVVLELGLIVLVFRASR